LIAEERDQKAITNVQHLVAQNGAIQQLIEEATTELDLPSGLLGQIKTNLNIDRDIDAEITFATDEYNIAVCRKLAEGMRSKLPRELRDIVYRCLSPGTLTLFRDFAYCSGPYTYCLDEEAGYPTRYPYISVAPRTKTDCFCPEHFWRDEVLGVENARELMESFYRDSAFSMRHVQPRANLENGTLLFLMKNDRFGLQFQPSTLISRVVQELCIDGDAHTQTVPYGTRQYEQITRSVKELFSLRKKSRIQINVRVGTVPYERWQMGQEPQAQALNKLMELLFSDLVHLRQAKYELTVKLSDGTSQTSDMFEQWMERLDTTSNGTGE
jgi:hypothetical protein